MHLWSRFIVFSSATACLLIAVTNTGWCAASASASGGNSTARTVTPDVPSPIQTGERATELAARFFDPLLADAQTDTVRATLLHQRGVLYLRSDYKQKAITDFNSALQLLPQDHEERLALLFHRACALLLRPKPDARAAIADITVCLRAEPNDPEALIVRANAYRKLGKKEMADADINRAAILAPKSDTAVRALLQNAMGATR
ncbi:MAG: hypothetical protein H7145_10270 [Akkermansiaceae bacterium]|nr:hypothetical protein [Armatimonadota bacterium]